MTPETPRPVGRPTDHPENWLVKLRRNYGFASQRELADRADVSPATITKLETGFTRRPRPTTARKLAAAFGMSLNHLLDLCPPR